MNAKSGGARRSVRPSEPRKPRTPPSRVGRGPDTIRWQQAVLPVVLVAVVLAASLVANGRVHKAAAIAGDTAVTLTRTLSCINDVRNSSTRTGTVPTSVSGVSVSGTRVTFTPSLAASGYAVQWASGKTRGSTWLASRACPTLGDDWWFVGAGSSEQHDTVLTLDNPQPVDATFSLTVYGPQGQILVPGGGSFLVHAGTSQSWNLASLAATKSGDITVHVNVTRGLVAASMWDTWARTPAYARVHQWVPSAASPSRHLQLMTVPGTVMPGSTLLVTNPGSVNAVVRVQAVNSDATFTPTEFNVLNVPPGATISVPFGDLHKVSLNSLILSSTSRVTAALRSVDGSAEAYAVPAQRIGAQSTAGLPTGIPATLTLTATTASTVAVLVVDAHGNALTTTSIQVPAGKAVTVALPKKGVALRLRSDRGNTVSASVSLSDGGIATIGMVPTANAAMVPVVIPQPY